MDRETVIAKLRDHEAELKSAGVLSLRLFGSVYLSIASLWEISIKVSKGLIHILASASEKMHAMMTVQYRAVRSRLQAMLLSGRKRLFERIRGKFRTLPASQGLTMFPGEAASGVAGRSSATDKALGIVIDPAALLQGLRHGCATRGAQTSDGGFRVNGFGEQ